MASECDTGTETCSDCGNPLCPRCGRCKGRYIAHAPGDWKFECPSWTCRVKKALSALCGSPYTKANTPGDE